MAGLLSVSVKLNTTEVSRYLRVSVPGGVARATARGINKAIALVQTRAVRDVADRRAFPVREVKRQTYIRKASARGKMLQLSAVLSMSGRPISLKHYNAQIQGQRGRGKKTSAYVPGASPVSVMVVKGARKVVEGAFVGTNGHVFRRTTTKRLPVEILFGPSLPTAFVQPIVVSAMRVIAETRTPGLIEREMLRELRLSQGVRT